jgi:peptide chain release factor 3
LEPLGYSVARWVLDGWPALEKAGRLFNTMVVKDNWDRPVLLSRMSGMWARWRAIIRI